MGDATERRVRDSVTRRDWITAGGGAGAAAAIAAVLNLTDQDHKVDFEVIKNALGRLELALKDLRTLMQDNRSRLREMQTGPVPVTTNEVMKLLRAIDLDLDEVKRRLPK